jgi:hypothetical protein
MLLRRPTDQQAAKFLVLGVVSTLSFFVFVLFSFFLFAFSRGVYWGLAFCRFVFPFAFCFSQAQEKGNCIYISFGLLSIAGMVLFVSSNQEDQENYSIIFIDANYAKSSVPVYVGIYFINKKVLLRWVFPSMYSS